MSLTVSWHHSGGLCWWRETKKSYNDSRKGRSKAVFLQDDVIVYLENTNKSRKTPPGNEKRLSQGGRYEVAVQTSLLCAY